MSDLSDVQIMGVTVIIGSVFFFIVGCVAWFIRDKRSTSKVPLNDLMDGPEQVAEDQSATAMWDSFEEADVHGIEVDDTAAEADMVSRPNLIHNPGFAVGSWSLLSLAYEDRIVADIDAWMKGLDVEAWLGERGWL